MEQNTTLGVRGMTCGGCVASVKRVLEALPGVHSADVSLANATATIRHDAAETDVGRLKTAIEGAGFEVV
jgi:copper chaperone